MLRLSSNLLKRRDLLVFPEAQVLRRDTALGGDSCSLYE
jgi:hypothetical protein